MGVQDAADIGVVRVHRGVHGDHSTLDGRQVTLQKGSVQPDPHHRGRSVVSERRARSEVHLLRPWDPKAHVSMSVGGDCSACHHPLGDIYHLIDQVLVHYTPEPCQPRRPRAENYLAGLTKRSGRAAPTVRSTRSTSADTEPGPVPPITG